MIKLIRFFGWLIFIPCVTLTIVFFFMLFENDVPIGARIFAIVLFGLLDFLGFRLIRFRKKQETPEKNFKLYSTPDKKEPISEKPTENPIVVEQSESKSPVINHKNDNTDPAMQAYNAVVSARQQKAQTNRNNAPKGGGRYAPLLELCAEMENDAENNYIPFDDPISVEIVYCDREGERTTRKIDVRYIAKSDYDDSNYYFKAFCHLRNEDRAFNVERIQKTTVDGNVVDFVQYIVDTYRNTDQYKETIQYIRTRNLLNSTGILGCSAKILTYISRIDGIFTRKEKVTIASFLKELDIEQTDIEIDDYVKGLPELEISAMQYKNIVKIADISEKLIEKAREIAGKDPIRLGAFELLFQQFKKNTPQIEVK